MQPFVSDVDNDVQSNLRSSSGATILLLALSVFVSESNSRWSINQRQAPHNERKQALQAAATERR
jgi:hypothetical protein